MGYLKICQENDFYFLIEFCSFFIGELSEAGIQCSKFLKMVPVCSYCCYFSLNSRLVFPPNNIIDSSWTITGGILRQNATWIVILKMHKDWREAKLQLFKRRALYEHDNKHWKKVWWSFFANNKRVKGTVRDFLPRNILRMGFFQAPYSVSVSFSNLASNSGKYSLFLIDSPLLFIAECWYSPSCLLRRVVTSRIIHNGELQIYEFSAETLACRLMLEVDPSRIV